MCISIVVRFFKIMCACNTTKTPIESDIQNPTTQPIIIKGEPAYCIKKESKNTVIKPLDEVIISTNLGIIAMLVNKQPRDAWKQNSKKNL